MRQEINLGLAHALSFIQRRSKNQDFWNLEHSFRLNIGWIWLKILTLMILRYRRKINLPIQVCGGGMDETERRELQVLLID